MSRIPSYILNTSNILIYNKLEIQDTKLYICYDPDVKLSISRNGQANCPFHEMDNPTVHFMKWTNPYIFCYPFHEMDKVMYES